MDSSIRKFLLIAVLLAVGCLARPDDAKPQEQENTGVAVADSAKPQEQESSGFTRVDSCGTVAFVLAISGRPLGVLPVPISSIRAAASTQLTTTLSAQGFTVIPEDTVLSMMRKWRVRDGRSFPQGFLHNLADSLGVERLIVANLIVQPGRLYMTARYLDPDSAILLKVNMTELVIAQPDDEVSEEQITDWLVGAREASEIVADASIERPDSARGIMLILDTQSVGCSASTALVASHALLGYYVGHGAWDLIDPGVTTSALHDAGYSSKYLGVEARALLRKTFASRGLVIPGLTSYAPARKGTGRLVIDDDSAARAEPMLLDFAISLRLVDLTSGSIAAGKEVFFALPSRTGWFGIPRKDTPLNRLKVAAGQVWSDMQNALEEY